MLRANLFDDTAFIIRISPLFPLNNDINGKV